MSTAGIFDKYHEKYDNWYSENTIIALNELKTVKQALDYPYHPCLEVGVGSGWFASKVVCDIGLDPSYNMLLKAKKRRIEVIQGLGESLPSRSRVFKTVLIIVTICFVDNSNLVLKEAVRVVKGDGRIILCIVPRDSPWGKYYTKLSKAGHLFYRVARFYTINELIRIASRMNLELEKCMGTLSFHPEDTPFREGPRKCIGGEGFVCLRFKPSFPQTSQSYQ
ncbi:MAG: methyltransferase domain-containing protein [Desulfurococcales archaeon]|nr:methyltransferase domain-containing protein [Desulfurococcales archaeon]